MLFVQVFAHVQIVLVQAGALVSTESSFSIHAFMKNVARTGYIYIIECNFKIL